MTPHLDGPQAHECGCSRWITSATALTTPQCNGRFGPTSTLFHVGQIIIIRLALTYLASLCAATTSLTEIGQTTLSQSHVHVNDRV